MSNKPLFISEEIAQYLKQNMKLIFPATILQAYNLGCMGRCWYGLPEYMERYGGLHNYQCCRPRTEGSHFCQAHTIQYYSSGLPFGRIDQPPPDSPCKITDIDGHVTLYYWLKDSDGKKRDEVFLKQEEEKQSKYKERRGRGRPPTRKFFIQTLIGKN